MMEGAVQCLWNPGGLLPDLPQLTKPSQAVGQTAPIFGCNVCNKEIEGDRWNTHPDFPITREEAYT